jgi:hypothetical protein
MNAHDTIDFMLLTLRNMKDEQDKSIKKRYVPYLVQWLKDENTLGGETILMNKDMLEVWEEVRPFLDTEYAEILFDKLTEERYL